MKNKQYKVEFHNGRVFLVFATDETEAMKKLVECIGTIDWFEPKDITLEL